MQFLNKSENKNNKFNENISNMLSGLAKGTMTTLVLSQLLYSTLVASDNISSQNLSTNKTQSSLNLNNENFMANKINKLNGKEAFAKSVNETLLMYGLSNDVLLSDKLKNVILNDKTNYIDPTIKEEFNKYIVNKEQYSKEDYLKVKNSFIKLVEDHNKANPEFLIEEGIADMNDPEFDNINLSNKEDYITSIKNRSWVENGKLNDNDYELEISKLNDANILSKTTLEILESYKALTQNQMGIFDFGNVDFSKTIDEKRLDDVAKYNKMNSLYIENLDLLYISTINDINNKIKDLKSFDETSGKKYNFIAEEIKTLQDLKNSLITPSQKLLLDEKSNIEFLAKDINSRIKSGAEFHKNFEKDFDQKNGSTFDLNRSAIHTFLNNLEIQMYNNNAGLKELTSDKEILNKINTALKLNDNYLENDNKEKIKIVINSLLDDISEKYNNSFNEKLGDIKGVSKMNIKFDKDTILPKTNNIEDLKESEVEEHGIFER